MAKTTKTISIDVRKLAILIDLCEKLKKKHGGQFSHSGIIEEGLDLVFEKYKDLLGGK